MSFYTSHIQHSEDWRRIVALPRRKWSEADAQKLADDMTQVLKKPNGTMRLKPLQAIALAEIGMYGGLFGPVPVGGGKTLISQLAAYVLGAKFPVQMMPASLLAKTEREQIELSKHWRIPLNIRKVSIESQGRVSSARILDQYSPDLIIIDEAHRLKNPKAAATRRYTRYMADHPETKVVALSGTMIKHSLEDYAHLVHHSLKENAPVPRDRGELMEWAEVLDERTSICRVDPGALLDLATPEEKANNSRFVAARLGYQRRLLETPGVVSASGAQVACSLYINAVNYDLTRTSESNFRKLREEWKTPDDWELVQAVDVWRHARELAAGFHYVWDPRPPQIWLERRQDWSKFVRETLSKSRHLDSPKQVEIEVEAGRLRDGGLLARWKEVEKTFKPNTVPQWHDDSALQFCLEWGRKRPGIIWTDHSYFGRELARRGGWDYFGREGINAAGVPIDLAKASHVGKTIVASRQSNGTGRNLQAWSRNLVVSPPGGSDELEQLIARTHRPGQTADEVEVDLVFACAEHVQAWRNAVEGARMVQQTLGQDQKILMADVQIDLDKYGSGMLQGSRWTRTPSEKESGFKLPVM